MKKKTKNLVVLMAVFVLLCIGYLVMDFLPEKSGEDTVQEPAIEVTEFTMNDIASYDYVNADYGMGFEVTEDGYVQKQDAAFPVNTASVELQLEAIGNLTAIMEIDNNDKTEFGLEEPEITISVTLKDGTVRNFALGDKALFEEAYYLSDEENNLIYLVSDEIYTEFSCTWSSMVKKEEMVHVAADQIMKVTVETAGKVTLQMSCEDEQEGWQIVTAEEIFVGDTDAVTDALAMFANYSVKSTLAYNCQNFSDYGLDNPSTVVTVTYCVPDEDGSITENSRENPKTLVFEFGNQPDDNTYSVRINGSSYVYGMSTYYAEGVSVFEAEELRAAEEETEAAE